MKNLQKLGYMALGAVLLAVGIIIGQWGAPGIEAQSNGVFNKIVCREIQVVDRNGRQAILISAGNESALITILDPQSSMPAIMLGSLLEMNQVRVADKILGGMGVALQSHKSGSNGVSIYNRGSEANAVLLASTPESNYVSVSDKLGKETVTLKSAGFVGNSVTVFDNQQRYSIQLSGGAGINSLTVFNEIGLPGINLLSGKGANAGVILNQQGEVAIGLASNDKKNRVFVIDKTGKEMSLGD